MDSFERQEERIRQIFGEDDIPSVDVGTLKHYQDFLQAALTRPCQVTGMEDFGWEEYYVFGPGDEEEYEELKKTRPSYRDVYDLLTLEEEPDDHVGILIKVKRVSDKKTFVLPLADLEATDKASNNHQLLDDYASWFVNWR